SARIANQRMNIGENPRHRAFEPKHAGAPREAGDPFAHRFELQARFKRAPFDLLDEPRLLGRSLESARQRELRLLSRCPEEAPKMLELMRQIQIEFSDANPFALVSGKLHLHVEGRHASRFVEGEGGVTTRKERIEGADTYLQLRLGREDPIELRPHLIAQLEDFGGDMMPFGFDERTAGAPPSLGDDRAGDIILDT